LDIKSPVTFAQFQIVHDSVTVLRNCKCLHSDMRWQRCYLFLAVLCLNADTHSLYECRQTLSVLMQAHPLRLNAERPTLS